MNGLTYSIPLDGQVRLELFSIDGRRIALLAEGYRSAGEHVASLIATGCTAGPHFARLSWESQVLTRRIVVVK
jgi:hypothetical protein